MRTCTLIVALLLAFTTASAQIYLDTPSLVIPVRDATVGGSHRFHVLWNKLVFTTSLLTGTPTGDELWTYDGLNTVTPAPEVYPGNISGVRGVLGGKTFSAVINNVLYFSGVGPTHGNEVFKWDGVNAPTIVADIMPGTNDSGPGEFTVLNNKLYFFADSTFNHFRLYEYDPVTNICNQTPFKTRNFFSYINSNITAHNDKLYITVDWFNDYFFEYDPVTKQSKKITAVYNNGTHNAHMGVVISYGSKIYYTSQFSGLVSHPNYGQLYSYDGSSVNHISQGHYVDHVDNGIRFYYNKYLLPHNGKVYFWGDVKAADTACTIYSYDTLTGQTTQLPGIKPSKSGMVCFMGVFKNNIYYKDNKLLIRYDGTKADTMLPFDFECLNMIEYNNEIYLTGKSKDQDPNYSMYRLRDTLVPGTPPSSIQEISFQADIKLYPNPATDIVNLEINLRTAGTISIHVTEISGREIQTIKPTLYSAGKNSIMLQLNDTPPGNYIVTLHNSNGKTLWSGKLVHQ